jgi:NADH dehydrogenase FAD-containing subunit
VNSLWLAGGDNEEGIRGPMANVLILGGGFGGVIAAESLARQLSKEHQITLVSRNSKFIFYPELVRLAFGKCKPQDISFDLREAMLDRRVRFIVAAANVALEIEGLAPVSLYTTTI